MSYSDFTLEKARRDFKLTVRDRPLFATVEFLKPSSWLEEAFAKGQDLAVTSEKARSEFIVAPTLMECRTLLGHDLRIFSGAQLSVDPERGLNGPCDFILGRSDSSSILQAPLMVIVEAKKHDIEEGLGQCAAQMVAVMAYNDREGKPVPYVYGCVTNGDLWQFVKLTGNELCIHTERLPVQELGKILWFVVQCVRDIDREASAFTAA